MKNKMKLVKLLAVCTLTVILVVIMASAVFAAGTGMPWEKPLNSILLSITGPVAKIIGVIAIVSTGLALSFGEGGGGFKKLLMVVFGLSIAFSATSFFLTFFRFGNGIGF